MSEPTKLWTHQSKVSLHPTVWISIVFGLVAVSGCTLPFVNAWMINLGVIGVVAGAISLFLRNHSMWGIFGILLSGVGVLASLYFQQQLRDDMNDYFNSIPTVEGTST
jgi:hypothetical protein